MKSLNKLSALALAVLIPAAAKAVPVKFPECAKTKSIHYIDGSSVAYWNEDCTMIYVGPPTMSQLSVTHYTPYSTLANDCASLDSAKAGRKSLEQAIAANNESLNILSQDILKLQKQLSDNLIPVGQTRDSMNARLNDLLDQSDKLRTRIQTYKTQDDNNMLSYGKLADGQGQFKIESTYPKLLNDFQQANPGVAIVALPIDQMYMTANEVTPENSDETSMPAVRKMVIPALGEMPLLMDPRILAAHKELLPTKAPQGSKFFNGGLVGDITLSTVGACSVQNILGSTVSTFRANDIQSFMAINATYNYQIQVRRHHKLWYDYQKLIQIIHEQTTKGGFFNTSTLDSLTDNRSSSEWIGFEVESQDGRYEYSDEYIKETKKDFLDRALAQIISLQSDNPSALAGLIAPGKNGSSEIGDQLQKCPHLYCQIGAAGFKVLGAIFGSTKATASLLKTVSGHQEETVDEKKMVPAYGTFGFQ